MKGITYTQVAQYCVLIFAYLLPAVAIALVLTGVPIPQLAIAEVLPRLDGLSTELGLPVYSEAFTNLSRINVLAITVALMVGTAGLPHVIVRFYTVRSVSAARWSAGWALLFIALLYTTAPTVAVFAKFFMLSTLAGQPVDAVASIDWVRNWMETGLITLRDGNGDGVMQAAELFGAGGMPASIDRDIVVLALPVDALRFYCRRIIEARPEWRAMVDNVDGVETQTVRLWFSPTLEQIGWNLGPPILSTYVKPFSTWEDNGDLVRFENWPPDRTPHAVATVFGPLPAPLVPPGPEDHDYPRRQQDAARAAVLAFLQRDVGSLWPLATDPADPTGIDWKLLVDLEDRSGPARLDAQYVRANAGPLERYTMAKAGRLQYRLRPDQSGIPNLFLAGDWTRNGAIVGCVEGAFMSGLMASRAICGNPATIPSEGNI